MTLHPVLPPLLLVVTAAVLVVAQVLALRRWRMSGRNRVMLWRWFGVTFAALLLVWQPLGLCSWSRMNPPTRIAGDAEPNVFLIVDRSPDMAVRDLEGRTRMEVARNDLETLIDRYPRCAVRRHRVRQGPFAGLAALGGYVEPATGPGHHRPVRLQPGCRHADQCRCREHCAAVSVDQCGSAVSAGHDTGLLPRCRARESLLPAREFVPPAGSVDGGAVLGYGTTAGGPIPGSDIAAFPHRRDRR